jgi:hypothetical protein
MNALPKSALSALLAAMLVVGACGSDPPSTSETGTDNPDMGAPDVGSPDVGAPDARNNGTVVPPRGAPVLLEGGFTTSGPTLGGGGNVRVISQGFEVSDLTCRDNLCATGGFAR